MSGTWRTIFFLVVGVLFVGFCLAAVTYWGLSQQANALAANLSGIATENGRLATEVAELEAWNSYQSTQIGAQQLLLGPFSNAAGQHEPSGQEVTPYPQVYLPPGAVLIEGGSCCVGGTAGETIDVVVQFLPERTELAEAAVEMRVMVGAANVTLADMAPMPWEPLAAERVYPVYLAINWTTFWIHVQYRAADGTVSALYSDEIGVEGMPAPQEP